MVNLNGFVVTDAIITELIAYFCIVSAVMSDQMRKMSKQNSKESDIESKGLHF